MSKTRYSISKARYICETILFMFVGFIAALGIIDHDPVIKILCTLIAMGIVMLQVFNTWVILR